MENPGGTVELNYNDHLNKPPLMDLVTSTCRREICEESGLVVSDLQFQNIYRYYTYSETGENEWAKKLLDGGLSVVGDLSFMYTARLVGKFTHEVDEVDKYPEMKNNGKFYKYLEVKNKFTPEQQEVIEAYINAHPILNTDSIY